MSLRSNGVNSVRRLDHLVGDQELGERQGGTDDLLAFEVGELADEIAAKMVSLGKHLPEEIFQTLGRLVGDASADAQGVDGLSVAVS